ncbi:unnamed protein product [Agarophyton chilense]
MSCATRHPHLPPVPLTRSVCLHCTLHTLQNHRALPTLRRAAAAALTVLPSSPSTTIGEPLMMLVLRSLTDTLFKTPLLHTDLLPLCTSLASSWQFPPHGARAVLISSCTDAIIRNDSPPPAIALLAALLPPSSSTSKQALPLIPISSADAVCSAVFRCASRDYAAASQIIQHVICHVSPSLLPSFPSLLESMLPPRPCHHSRRLFLHTALHLYSSALPFETKYQRMLNQILCASFISSDPTTRELASKLLQMCHKKSSLSNTFEYLIEGLREAHLPPLRSKRNALVKPNLAALALLAPSVESVHWCYAFRTVLSISEYADGAIHHLCHIVKAAVTTAPTSVFAAAMLPELVSFVMRLMSDENLPCAVECLHILLKRYRSSLQELEAILGVLECLVEKNLSIAFSVIRAAVLQFKKLVGRKALNEELQPLGRRLVIIIFDRCATLLEEAQGIQYDIEDAIIMFSDGLDDIFIQVRACSEDDWLGIQRWCWRFFPPRRVLITGSDAVPTYLWKISARLPQSMQVKDLNSLSSEECILTDLAGETDLSSSSPAYILLDKAVQLQCINDICLPEAILEAVLKYLHLLERDDTSVNEKLVAQKLRILGLISNICFQHGLCFPADDIEQPTLHSVLQSRDFSLNIETHRMLVRSIITIPKRGTLDVSVWDAITSRYRNPLNVDDNIDNLVASIVVDEGASCSLLYALTHSLIPEVIVEGVLDIFERKQGCDVLFKVLKENGSLSTACAVLKALPHQGMISESELVCGRHVAYKRSKSLLLFVSSSGIISACAESWDLLRIVCDTFTRESMSQLTFKSRIELLSYLVRCIIALLRGLEDSGKISFIRHSGVEAQGIKLLTSVPTTTRASGILISSIACLLNLFMHKTDLVVNVMPELPINIEFLAEPRTWERLLTPGLELGNVDETNRMANCWHLLNSLLRGGKGNLAKFQTIMTPNIVVLLHTAAASWSRLLCEAALNTFRTIFIHKYHEQSVLCRTGVFKRLCSFAVSNFCVAPAEQLTSSEILFLSELARNSFIDQHLCKIIGRISDWCSSHEDAGRESSRQPMFYEMSVLLRATNERLELNSVAKRACSSTKLSNSQEHLNMIFSRTSDNDGDQKCVPDVLLGRYTMIWKATGHLGSPVMPICTKSEKSNTL